MKIVQLMVVALAVLTMASASHAQTCGVPYAQQDREEVRRVLVGPLESPNQGGVGAILLRLHELALVSTRVLSQTQRLALNQEYQAWISEIDRLGRTGGGISRLRPRTYAWLERTIDPLYLHLDGTGVVGPTNLESIEIAYVAANRSAAAIQSMWRCF